MSTTATFSASVRSIVYAYWSGESASEDREAIESALVEAGLAKAGSVRVDACGLWLDGIVEPGSDIEIETPDGVKVYAVVSDLLPEVGVRVGSPLYLSMYS